MSTTVCITGEMTYDCEQMLRETVSIMDETIKKISAECGEVDPATYDWSLVDRNTWFACLNPLKKKVYWFPMCESENKEKNYKRAKQGMAYFKSKGWEVYQVQ